MYLTLLITVGVPLFIVFAIIYSDRFREPNSLPAALSGLFKKEEHLHSFDADYNQVTDFIKLNN